VTLVLTDVQGSTELWEWDQASTAAAVDLHDRLLRSFLDICNGYEVGGSGGQLPGCMAGVSSCLLRACTATPCSACGVQGRAAA